MRSRNAAPCGADAGSGQRATVGDPNERLGDAPVPPARLDKDRVVRRNAIEIRPGREAAFAQQLRHPFKLGRLPERHGDDPIAGFALAHLRFDALQDIVDAAHPCHGRKRLFQAFPIHVGVRVDQARDDGATIKIDDLRGGIDQRSKIRIGSNRIDAPAAEGNCLRNLKARVDGDDLAVAQDERPRARGRVTH
jgi:hypothetical protein